MNANRPRLFDFHTAQLRLARARKIGGEAFLTQAAAEGLAERLSAVNRRFEHGLVVGGEVPDSLRPFAASWTEADFDQAEMLAAEPGAHDLAISLFSLQAIDDLPGALIQMRRALKPDGLFLGTLFGGATLTELKESFAAAELQTKGGVSPRISLFGDVRDMGSLLQRAGFALPVTDSETLSVRYGDFFRLVADLRAHAQTTVLAERSRRFLRRDTLAALLDHYRSHHGEDGKFKATFEILTLTGWAPHPDQQQPLKPGSAKARLGEALGAVERKI
jgi:SAM-dependent methyltransferase